MMTPAEIQQRVMLLSQQAFGRPFDHQATFNARLKTTGGRYFTHSHHLEFNPKMAALPEFDGIIKHELVHYHLHLQHQGYRHRDRDFKQLLAAVGGARYAPKLAVTTAPKPKRLWRYQCCNGHVLTRQRRIQVDKYRCGQCHGTLRLLGEVPNS